MVSLSAVFTHVPQHFGKVQRNVDLATDWNNLLVLHYNFWKVGFGRRMEVYRTVIAFGATICILCSRRFIQILSRCHNRFNSATGSGRTSSRSCKHKSDTNASTLREGLQSIPSKKLCLSESLEIYHSCNTRVRCLQSSWNAHGSRCGVFTVIVSVAFVIVMNAIRPGILCFIAVSNRQSAWWSSLRLSYRINTSASLGRLVVQTFRID